MRPAHDSVVTNVDDHAHRGALHCISREESQVLGLQGVLRRRRMSENNKLVDRLANSKMQASFKLWSL